MGNAHSTATVAPALPVSIKLPALRQDAHEPRPTSIIKATQQRRLKLPHPRELALSAHTAINNPNFIDWQTINFMLDSGYITCLRLHFDITQIDNFTMKARRLLSHARSLQTLELLSDCMPRLAALPFYSTSCLSDSLETEIPSLTSLSIATTLYQVVHFDAIAKIMIRAPHLRVLKLEGLNVSPPKQTDYGRYMPCRLEYLVLIRSLHLEHVTKMEYMATSITISRLLHKLLYLTVIAPSADALENGAVEFAGMLDMALSEPKSSIQSLHVEGLAMSDISLLRTENSIGRIGSTIPSCQQLTLHECSRVGVASVINALRSGRLPCVVQIETIWAPGTVSSEEYEALQLACKQSRVSMSQAMQAHYAPLIQAKKQHVKQEECASISIAFRSDTQPTSLFKDLKVLAEAGMRERVYRRTRAKAGPNNWEDDTIHSSVDDCVAFNRN